MPHADIEIGPEWLNISDEKWAERQGDETFVYQPLQCEHGHFWWNKTGTTTAGWNCHRCPERWQSYIGQEERY